MDTHSQAVTKPSNLEIWNALEAVYNPERIEQERDPLWEATEKQHKRMRTENRKRIEAGEDAWEIQKDNLPLPVGSR